MDHTTHRSAKQIERYFRLEAAKGSKLYELSTSKKSSGGAPKGNERCIMKVILQRSHREL